MKNTYVLEQSAEQCNERFLWDFQLLLCTLRCQIHDNATVQV